MNWADIQIQEYIRNFSDRLVQDSKKLVDDSQIYKRGGLSLSQIHNLLQKSRQAASIDGLTRFVDRESEKATQTEGKGWKFGRSGDAEGEEGKWFSDKLKESLAKVEKSYAKPGAERIGHEYYKKIGIMMARRFLAYVSWRISWWRMKLEEEETDDV